LVAQRPDRFRALGAVPLQDPGLAVAELRRCVRQLGFLGAEIGTRVGDRELGDTCFDPFFEVLAARTAGLQVSGDARVTFRGRGVGGRQLGVDVQQVHRLSAAYVARVGPQAAVQRWPAVHERLEV
jgi:predicted TIM-barrel fold metal-dependent hydrolase